MVRTIDLSQGLVALIDDEDYDRVIAAGSWCTTTGGRSIAKYAVHTVRRNGKRTNECLHTFLTGWRGVDHINGDGLDNRRANLRPATNAENNRNRKKRRDNASGFKGVTWHRHSGLWRARIVVDWRERSLGYYTTPEAAALAYDDAARLDFGEFARLNFPGADERAAR